MSALGRGARLRVEPCVQLRSPLAWHAPRRPLRSPRLRRSLLRRGCRRARRRWRSEPVVAVQRLDALATGLEPDPFAAEARLRRVESRPSTTPLTRPVQSRGERIVQSAAAEARRSPQRRGSPRRRARGALRRRLSAQTTAAGSPRRLSPLRYRLCRARSRRHWTGLSLEHDRPNPLGAGDWRAARAAIAAFYAARDYAPVWVDEDGLTDAGRSALAQLQRAGDDGLDLSAFALPRDSGPASPPTRWPRPRRRSPRPSWPTPNRRAGRASRPARVSPWSGRRRASPIPAQRSPRPRRRRTRAGGSPISIRRRRDIASCARN